MLGHTPSLKEVRARAEGKDREAGTDAEVIYENSLLACSCLPQLAFSCSPRPPTKELKHSPRDWTTHSELSLSTIISIIYTENLL